MRRIPLTQGKFALVDDADFDWLNQWKWHARKHRNTFYAVRALPRKGGPQKHVYMHQLLCAAGRVDHRDRDGLNNQRRNLRPTTNSQNMANSIKNKNNTSGFKGVSFLRGKWAAQGGSPQRYLGLFKTPEEAARAYDAVTVAAFGEFARLNFSH